MAALVESQLAAALSAFERRDPGAAAQIVEADKEIDEYDRRIETGVMDLLAAGPLDVPTLREVMTIMKITGELERVGDLAKNIGKRTIVLSATRADLPITGVARMGRASLRQLTDILDAYSARNLSAAQAVWGADDEVDELYNSVFREIQLSMMDDTSLINACTHLAFISKNLERVGDHATNIAEAIHFLMTGEPLLDERPKRDVTSSSNFTPPSDDIGVENQDNEPGE